MSRIPLFIVHGSLGSGKTTFIKNLLKIEDFKNSIIIENEFASENIDGQTLRESHGHDHIFEISGGCICCSSGEELNHVLEHVIEEKWTNPIILETTGIASFSQIVQNLLFSNKFLENFEIQNTIYIIDPLETSAEELEESKKLDIKLSDIIIINKMDLADKENVSKIIAYIKSVSPKSHVFTTTDALVDEIDTKSKSKIEEAIVENIDEIETISVDHTNLTYHTVRLDDPIELPKMEQMVKSINAADKIKRIKGHFFDKNGNWWRIESTRKHFKIVESDHKERGIIVFIGEIDSDIDNTIKRLLYG